MSHLPEGHEPRPAASPQPSRTPGRSEGSSLQASGAGAQSALGDVTLDRHGEIPLGTQLVWALRARIDDGRLPAGERLPGVRDLGAMFDVNANTARAVYQRLERAGLIESRQGMGTFVGRTREGGSEVGELAADTARRAQEAGVDPRELATALYASSPPRPHTTSAPPHTGSPPRPHTGSVDPQIERRQQLREQIAALEQALGEIETANPGLLAPPAPAPRLAGPRLLSAEELEQVRARLMRRLSEAQLALDARACGEQQTAPAEQRRGREPAKKATKRRGGPRPSARPSTA